MAGVVNFKLKREFDGVEIDGTWGQTDRGDGTQYEAGLTAGTDFADGRGSIIGLRGILRPRARPYLDRDFSKYSMCYAGGPGRGTLGPGRLVPARWFPLSRRGGCSSWPDRPSEAAFDALMVSYGYAPGEVPFFGPNLPAAVSTNTQFGFNADGTLFTTGNPIFLDNQFSGVANFRGERDPVFFNDVCLLVTTSRPTMRCSCRSSGRRHSRARSSS